MRIFLSKLANFLMIFSRFLTVRETAGSSTITTKMHLVLKDLFSGGGKEENIKTSSLCADQKTPQKSSWFLPVPTDEYIQLKYSMHIIMITRITNKSEKWPSKFQTKIKCQVLGERPFDMLLKKSPSIIKCLDLGVVEILVCGTKKHNLEKKPHKWQKLEWYSWTIPV